MANDFEFELRDGVEFEDGETSDTVNGRGAVMVYKWQAPSHPPEAKALHVTNSLSVARNAGLS